METLVRNWWAIGLRGAVAVVFGLILLAAPGVSLAFLVALYGAFMLIDGVLELVAAFRKAREPGGRWGSLVLLGVTSILAGLIAWFWPTITAVALLFLIGAWAIISGVLAILAAFELRKVIHGEFWMALSGALSVIFGVLVFGNPAAGAVALVWLIGVYAIFFGISLIALGFRLRALGHRAAPGI